jgi:hypothetical protein
MTRDLGVLDTSSASVTMGAVVTQADGAASQPGVNA